MDTWINSVLSNGHPSAIALIAVLLLGMASVFTCACNFAILGVVAGYSGASQESSQKKILLYKSIAFLAGTLLAMSVIGALFGFAGRWISFSMGNYWKIAAGLVAILFGLYSMDLVPFKLPGIRFRKGEGKETIGSAILMGITVGGLSAAANTCCNPFFPVILAASFVKGSVLWGFLMLLFFALGFGLPLTAMVLGIGLGLGELSGLFKTAVKVIRYAGGTALVLLGFYLLISF